MSIIALPDDLKISETVCVLCGDFISLNEATAGSVDLNRIQVFACNRHLELAESTQYVRGWILFTVGQQKETSAIA
jgi:hypothetical protein